MFMLQTIQKSVTMLQVQSSIRCFFFQCTTQKSIISTRLYRGESTFHATSIKEQT